MIERLAVIVAAIVLVAFTLWCFCALIIVLGGSEE